MYVCVYDMCMYVGTDLKYAEALETFVEEFPPAEGTVSMELHEWLGLSSTWSDVAGDVCTCLCICVYVYVYICIYVCSPDKRKHLFIS